MAELKPCPYCGSTHTFKIITTEYVHILCDGCGAGVKEYGKTRRYDSVARCSRYVMPKAVEAWNRRVTDENA